MQTFIAEKSELFCWALVKSAAGEPEMTRSKFEWLARAGYSARGIVFLLIAALAVFSSFGGKADTKSALDAVLEQPLGRVWLGLIGLGLLGFVAWRLAQSIANADNHDHSVKSYLIRAALLGSAVTYMGLAIYAFQGALGFGSGGDGGEKGLAALAMSQPFGRFLAGAIGLGFVVGGAVTALKGITRRFERYLTLGQSRPLLLICVYGLVSRGVVFVIVGIFFCYAAFTVDPGQAGSISDALTFVRQLPFGAVLYLVVAIGLAAFGIYNLVEARYRTVSTPKLSQVRSELPLSRN
ncbi:DUF1206 domain-containing protein [Rhizobium sophorae]|uniref:DUF1206 domain-containing protein n=1 Tax=Rhizobium sophorae TaxID=1535242 RepID=A0A7Y3S3E9_9HYPH|nr:DUF1206 domain-containing protein [Rhizobium sophorae]MBX4859909.1 DUF1206 domain-containing protein [Rhizobium bangladeshense]NNU36334.1 DUF1206 domain-containing protein [Rhizobium sophorae]